MAGGADNERSVDGVGVHAGLVVVVHGHKSPVGDHTGDADAAVLGLAGCGCGGGVDRSGDEVFNSCCVEKLDVGEAEHF